MTDSDPAEATDHLWDALFELRDCIIKERQGDSYTFSLKSHGTVDDAVRAADAALARPARREGEAGLAKELHDAVMKIRPKDFADTSDYTCGHFDGVRAAVAVLLAYPKLAALAHPPEPDRATESERDRLVRERDAARAALEKAGQDARVVLGDIQCHYSLDNGDMPTDGLRLAEEHLNDLMNTLDAALAQPGGGGGKS